MLGFRSCRKGSATSLKARARLKGESDEIAVERDEKRRARAAKLRSKD